MVSEAIFSETNIVWWNLWHYMWILYLIQHFTMIDLHLMNSIILTKCTNCVTFNTVTYPPSLLTNKIFALSKSDTTKLFLKWSIWNLMYMNKYFLAWLGVIAWWIEVLHLTLTSHEAEWHHDLPMLDCPCKHLADQ